MYKIVIDNAISLTVKSIHKAMEIGLLFYKNDYDIDILSNLTGEVIMYANDEKIYIAECIKIII